MSESKQQKDGSVNTGGGAYVGGNVNTDGGDFVGRDKTVHSQAAGTSLADLTTLVAEMRRLLPEAGLDTETTEVIDADFTVVEAQVAKPAPNKAIVVAKLTSVAALLSAVGATVVAAKPLLPLAQQALEWAGRLLP